MIQNYEMRIDNKKIFDQCCIQALSTIPDISAHRRKAHLEFSLADIVQDSPENPGQLLYSVTTDTLDIVSPAFSGQQSYLTLNTDNQAVKKFAATHISALSEQGYSITGGKVILARYIPRHCKGAGYDYLLDEDDYEESTFEIVPPALKLKLADEMPQKPRDNICIWFCELQKRFS